MSSSLAHPPSACQVGNSCQHTACFQARLEATTGRRPVRHCANACAGHLGDLVQALAAWARDRNLTDGHLTVLAIDPSDHRHRNTTGSVPGFAFSTIPLPP